MLLAAVPPVIGYMATNFVHNEESFNFFTKLFIADFWVRSVIPALSKNFRASASYVNELVGSPKYLLQDEIKAHKKSNAVNCRIFFIHFYFKVYETGCANFIYDRKQATVFTVAIINFSS